MLKSFSFGAQITTLSLSNPALGEIEEPDFSGF
jgi:hypothetical protein